MGGEEISSLEAGPDRRRLRIGLSAAAASAWVACSLYLTLAGSVPRFLRLGADTALGHLLLGVLVGGCVLCLVHAVSDGRRSLLRYAPAAALAGGLFLVATELLQYLSSTRQPELQDAAMDVVGVAAVTGALVASFRAARSRSDRIANGFVGVAIVLAGVVVGTTIAFSPEADDEDRARPARSAAADDCTRRFATFERPRVAMRRQPDRDPGESVEPLVRFDLASDPTRSSGALPAITVDRHGTDHLEGAGVVFSSPADALMSDRPVADLNRTISSGRAFSVEAWFRLGDVEQTGPTRIVTLSSGTKRDQLNFHLGVERNQVSVRIRTGCQLRNSFVTGRLSLAPTHVAVTFDDGLLLVFIDGHVVAEVELAEAELGGWDPAFPVSMGNEATLDRPFRGLISVVAFHDRALSRDEVAWQAGDTARRAAVGAVDAGDLVASGG